MPSSSSSRERLGEYALVFLKQPNGDWSARLETDDGHLIWSSEHPRPEKAPLRAEARAWYDSAPMVLA